MTDCVILNSAFHTERKDELQIVAPHLRVGVAGVAAYLRELGASVAVPMPTSGSPFSVLCCPGSTTFPPRPGMER